MRGGVSHHSYPRARNATGTQDEKLCDVARTIQSAIADFTSYTWHQTFLPENSGNVTTNEAPPHATESSTAIVPPAS
jgi:hypothetical protein